MSTISREHLTSAWTMECSLRITMLKRALCALAATLALPGLAVAEPMRVVSLDQCADQFVMALAPRAAIAGVSYRADDHDSALLGQAEGLPRVRNTSEAILAVRPTVVVRSWGGDPALVRRLQRRGVQVVQVKEEDGFAGVEANVRRVAGALGAQSRGERLLRRMRTKLEVARGAWDDRRALYLTPSGYTAGEGTLVAAILAAAGLRNAATGASWRPIPTERLVLNPPALVVLGFFDALARDRWSPGRSPVMRRLLQGRTAHSLPASQLGCPGWFAADAAASLAAVAP